VVNEQSLKLLYLGKGVGFHDIIGLLKNVIIEQGRMGWLAKLQFKYFSCLKGEELDMTQAI